MKKPKRHLALLKSLGLAALLIGTSPVLGAGFTNVTEISAPDPVDGQFYGLSVVINGNIAVVGAPVSFLWWLSSGPTPGAAYVYVKTDVGWTLQQELVASDSGPGNQFGYAVAMAGDTIVVGAPRRTADGKTGAVYVFKQSGSNWTQQAILTSSTPRPFGLSVALRGGTLVVGGLEDSLSQGGTSDSGLAFVFVRSGDNWSEQGNLMRNGVPDHNRYGTSVDIKGNTVVVGTATPFGSGPESVYIFSRRGSTWSEDTQLTSTNNSSTFGQSVSLNGATLSVGDPSTSAVFLYEHAGANWQPVQTLTGDSGSQFGSGVAQTENSILVGAWRATVNGVTSGAAYLYGLDEETGNWSLNQTLAPADGQTFDIFGQAVGLSGTSAIVGAPRHTPSGSPQSGAVYIYDP
jgi:hypothetical protein